MKILSYELKDGMIRVTTDNKDESVFVYFANKFNSLKELEQEINKKNTEIEKNKQKASVSTLIAELDDKIIRG
jgi:hypothetical protein